MVGSYVNNSPEFCFVVEGLEGSICGYLMAALDSKAYYNKMDTDWIPFMKENYPLPVDSTEPSPEPVQMLPFEVSLRNKF